MRFLNGSSDELTTILKQKMEEASNNLEFEQALDKSRIVNHIQKDDRIRVRYLSTTSPYDGAVQVEPNLEDAYLCLLKEL